MIEVELVAPDGTRHPLVEGTATVGRGEDCVVLVPQDDDVASRHHASITVGADGAWLRDAGSTNGTMVNGAPVTASTRIYDGDRLTIGTTEFTVRSSEPPPARRSATVIEAAPSASVIHRLRVERSISRMWWLVGCLAAFVLAVGAFVALRDSGGSSSSTVREVAEAAADSTVILRATPAGGSGGTMGSGVVIEAGDGLVLTSAHVVAGGQELEVGSSRFDGGYRRAELVAVDACQDLALVQVDAAGLSALPLADRDVAQGDLVVAAGYPRTSSANIDYQTYPGNVSVAATSLDNPGDNQPVLQGVIQHTAPTEDGASGGPLLDERGEIVGINAAIAREVSGQAYAVGRKAVAASLDRMRRREAPWWTGATLAEEPDRAGPLVVVSVVPGSPADRAGVVVGDHLTGVERDGNDVVGAVRSVADLCSALDADPVDLAFSAPTGEGRSMVRARP